VTSVVSAGRKWGASLSSRPENVGLGVMLGLGLGAVALAAQWVKGPSSLLVAVAMLTMVVGLIYIAFAGGIEARKSLAPYGLLKPGMIWLCLFFLAPLWSMVVMSLSSKEGRFDFFPDFTWNFENYRIALTKFRPQFIRSFSYAAIATLLTVVIGYPLAYFIAFRGGKYRNILLGLVVVPFFTSYLIRTLAWNNILADEGPVVSLINTLQLTGVFESLNIMQNGKLMNTPAAVIGGLTYNFLPFMVLPIYVSLEKIDVRLVDAAMDLYSSASQAFRKVVLPLSLPGLFAGGLLVFIPAAGDFVNAQFLGNPQTTMIGNSIQDQFLRQLNYPVASAMSFVLMIIITIIVLIYTKFMGTEDLA
jgi:spermidine/putrescine transport system permease protein